MLYPTPPLTAADRAVLAAIDELRDQIRHEVQTRPGAPMPGLRRFLTADVIASSNWIEGFRVNTVDARDVMDGERDVDVSEENREETLAYHRMMAYMQSLHDVADFEYSKGLLNALHWMLQGHRPRPAGQWRAGPVYVIDSSDRRVPVYTAPDTADVPGLMTELVDWLNTDDDTHPLIRAAMAHLHLVSIHPWPDGNGRMSRSLQTLMIAREGTLAPEFSAIEPWLGRSFNTWTYYQELQHRGAIYRPDQDVNGWIRLNLTAYHHQAQFVLRRIEQAVAVWDRLTDFVGDAGLVSPLYDVAIDRRVRRGRDKQARRDLRDLAAAGLLAPDGRARVRYYTEGPRFPEPVLELARTPFTLAAPYAK
ncbi:Fic family protein [Paractinoplanes atraurantiacus]|uniref:Fic family protein n=1 Tax=Paractinoplanes atraurantiacus TaxID=1036182 RepID=A0A285HU82_9ACTN|nr:Fic family protein [Actinoplanes atraurantiacus]SNY39239.1 Fic family protein [Actinoplanes atraurantiacus]